jgi:hypothetical protein
LQQDALYRLTRVWVDYTLFAHALATAQPLDDSATVAAAMWPMFSQLKWEKLHDRLVSRRVDFNPQQVDSAYQAGTHRLFQHILIQVPPNSAPTVLEEKRRELEAIRRRLVARRGRNFSELAARHSEDPGSKQQGGFLGVADRADPVVPEFRDAAWALAPGELSSLVRTAYGWHVIRRPGLGEVTDIYRFGLAEKLGLRADSVLIDSITAARDLKLTSGARASARETVQDLDAASGSDRVLVRFRGGSFRVRDLVRWIYSLEPRVAQAVATVPDEQLEQFLRLLAQRHLLLLMADSAGVELSPQEWQVAKAQHDSALALLRNVLRLTPELLRDSAATPAERQRFAAARVDEYLGRVVTGRAQFLPMPPFFSVALRERADWEIDQAGLRLALERARVMRAAQDSAAPPSPITPAPGPPPVPEAGR